jgi:hypothetical protein
VHRYVLIGDFIGERQDLGSPVTPISGNDASMLIELGSSDGIEFFLRLVLTSYKTDSKHVVLITAESPVLIYRVDHVK